MAPTKHEFQAKGPSKHNQRIQKAKESQEYVQPQELFLGIAARRENGSVEVGFCAHDGELYHNSRYHEP